MRDVIPGARPLRTGDGQAERAGLFGGARRAVPPSSTQSCGSRSCSGRLGELAARSPRFLNRAGICSGPKSGVLLFNTCLTWKRRQPAAILASALGGADRLSSAKSPRRPGSTVFMLWGLTRQSGPLIDADLVSVLPHHPSGAGFRPCVRLALHTAAVLCSNVTMVAGWPGCSNWKRKYSNWPKKNGCKASIPAGKCHDKRPKLMA